MCGIRSFFCRNDIMICRRWDMPNGRTWIFLSHTFALSDTCRSFLWMNETNSPMLFFLNPLVLLFFSIMYRLVQTCEASRLCKAFQSMIRWIISTKPTLRSRFLVQNGMTYDIWHVISTGAFEKASHWSRALDVVKDADANGVELNESLGWHHWRHYVGSLINSTNDWWLVGFLY